MTIFAEEWPPLWFALITPPQGEIKATQWLAAQGVHDAWHPTETVYTHSRKAPHKRIPRIRPIATGYLFTRLTRRPIWPFLIDQSRGKITDVLRIGDRPVAIGETELMVMQEVPERLRQMRDAAQAAARIRPGDDVIITAGSMAGWHITVDDIAGGIIRFTAPGGMPASIKADKVAKS